MTSINTLGNYFKKFTREQGLQLIPWGYVKMNNGPRTSIETPGNYLRIQYGARTSINTLGIIKKFTMEQRTSINTLGN